MDQLSTVDKANPVARGQLPCGFCVLAVGHHPGGRIQFPHFHQSKRKHDQNQSDQTTEKDKSCRFKGLCVYVCQTTGRKQQAGQPVL